MNITKIPTTEGTRFYANEYPAAIYIIDEYQRIQLEKDAAENAQVILTMAFLKRDDFVVVTEDKPITAEESYKKRYTAHKFDKNMKFLVYEDGFNDGEKNQWIKHAKIRKAAQRVIDSNPTFSLNDSSGLRPALKNLQPIEEI